MKLDLLVVAAHQRRRFAFYEAYLMSAAYGFFFVLLANLLCVPLSRVAGPLALMMVRTPSCW